MVVVSPTTCPHGFPGDTCEICRAMQPTPVLRAREKQSSRQPARLGSLPGGLAMVAVVAVIGFVVVGWVAAAFFAVLRILELLAVAAIAGGVGWRLGVRRGRRGRGRPG